MTEAESATDIRLMLKVRGGDLHALGVLYARHQAKVYALCYRMTGESHVAEDLVQETFLRVLRYRHSFLGESQFTTWLYRIARNVTLSHLESTKREASLGRQWLDHRTIVGDPGDAERLAMVEEALTRLPPDKREVLVFSRYHGMRYAEIAAVCDCSVSAVKTRVHRAINELRRILRNLEQADDEMRSREREAHRRSHG